MEPILENLYAKLEAKLGPVAAFVPTIAGALKVAVDEGDTAKVLAICSEADEFLDSGKALTAKIRAALAPDVDGISRLSGVEVAGIALAIEHAVDEGEDVIKGRDEDDGIPPASS